MGAVDIKINHHLLIKTMRSSRRLVRELNDAPVEIMLKLKSMQANVDKEERDMKSTLYRAFKYTERYMQGLLNNKKALDFYILRLERIAKLKKALHELQLQALQPR